LSIKENKKQNKKMHLDSRTAENIQEFLSFFFGATYGEKKKDFLGSFTSDCVNVCYSVN